MQSLQTRREWLVNTGSIVAGAMLSQSPLCRASNAAPASVSIAKCRSYDSKELVPALERMFDQLGGLGRFVKGKTVAIKINLTGPPTYRLGYSQLGETHYSNPHVIAAVASLMSKAGARRIRVLESPWSSADPVEECLLQANIEPREILSAAPNVEFENTNFLGQGKKYTRFTVPHGGLLFPAFDLNHSYEDCDVFVSLAKLKQHATTGVTLSMKNCFGITPATIYGTHAAIDEPSIVPRGGRDMIHTGFRQPSKSSPGEKDPTSPRDGGYRVPRAVVDLVSARPIDLAIVEGVKTMLGGEGPWISNVLGVASPGIIVAGNNPVATDAVCVALMGYDPMADRGTPPFEDCDSTLRLAENAGLGTRDLKRIEIHGVPIRDAVFDFRSAATRKTGRPAL